MVDRSTDKKLVSSHWVASEKLQRKLLVLVLLVLVVVVVCNHLFPPVGTRVLPKCISIDSFIL